MAGSGMVGASKAELETPCLVLDLDVLEGNVHKMQSRVNAADKALRPHAKTHKCSRLAKLQLAAGAIGICAAKVSEAESLVDAGVADVLVTGPVAAERAARRLVALLDRAPSLMVVVDSSAGIRILDKVAAEAGRRLDVLLDLDVGLHRTGLAPGRAPTLARRVFDSRCLRLRGVQAYAGQVQHMPRYADRRASSHERLAQAAAALSMLRATDSSCTILSGSGTGTAVIDLSVPELTELQAGSYALMDAEYLEIESAEASSAIDYRPALTLLSTVVSGPHGQHVTIDAGLKAMYHDGARPRVVNLEFAGLEYDWFGDEYGRLTRPDRSSRLPEIGSVVELVVSHCDPTVNLYDRFILTRSDRVVDVWPIDLRGRSQ